METMFVEAEITADARDVIEKAMPKLGRRVGLLTTAQHLGKVDEMKKTLEGHGKEVFLGENKKTKNKAEILGCEFSAAESIKDKVDSFLYIGTGRFHPLGIVLSTGRKVVCSDPVSNDAREIDDKDIRNIKKRKEGALAKFLVSDNIGVLASTKPGQSRVKEALELKEKLSSKKVYVLLSNTLDFNELENFPFLDCYVNTMCPRIGLDDGVRLRKPIINIDDIRHQIG